MFLLQGELDELEREEFFRLKKVQAKKKRDGAIQDAEVSPCTSHASSIAKMLILILIIHHTLSLHKETRCVCRQAACKGCQIPTPC